jgi:glycosyltransferase involved in cell wall biosynthesis
MRAVQPHIIHLSTVHSPADVRVFHKMCRTLSASGYRVTYIVPNDADGTRSGVAIRALPPRTGPRRRIGNLFRMLAAALRERGDLYHFHDPELLLIGVVLKLLGKRVIYDVHEDVPKQILSKHWIPRALRPIVSRATWCVEFVASRLCDGIVAATPSIARKFPPRKTVVVQNFPLGHEIAPLESTPFVDRAPAVVYVGCISVERGIRQLLQAASIANQSSPSRLVLAGACQPSSLASELATSSENSNTEFRGWCARDEVRQMMASARAGLVTFLPEPNHVEAQPNKLFEYMSAGLPVIASDFPLWREIVAANECGLLVDPSKPQEIASAIEYLVSNPNEAEAMGKRGLQAVQQKYNWERESRVLLSFYAMQFRPAHATVSSPQLPASLFDDMATDAQAA